MRSRIHGRPLMALLVMALLTAPLPILAAGCGDTDKSVEEALNEAADDIQQAIEEATAHTVEVTGFTCPIPEDDNTGTADEGNVFASVNVKIKNDSDEEVIVSSASFSIEDEDGTMYDSSILYDGPNAIGAADTLAPGEELEGILVFEVPAEAKPKVLVEETFVGEPVRVDLPAPS